MHVLYCFFDFGSSETKERSQDKSLFVAGVATSETISRQHLVSVKERSTTTTKKLIGKRSSGSATRVEI